MRPAAAAAGGTVLATFIGIGTAGTTVVGTALLRKGAKLGRVMALLPVPAGGDPAAIKDLF
jgi:multidrug transporter EmrE-like cation transporter